MKPSHWMMLAFAVSAVVGCSPINEYKINSRNRQLASSAWKNLHDVYCDVEYKDDFARGFKQGYIDVASGGDGCPPVTPPKHYWTVDYASPEGHRRTHAWYEGYKYGAVVAEQEGVGVFVTLPTGLETAAPPIDLSQIMGASATKPAAEAPKPSKAPDQTVPPPPPPTMPTLPAIPETEEPAPMPTVPETETEPTKPAVPEPTKPAVPELTKPAETLPLPKEPTEVPKPAVPTPPAQQKLPQPTPPKPVIPEPATKPAVTGPVTKPAVKDVPKPATKEIVPTKPAEKPVVPPKQIVPSTKPKVPATKTKPAIKSVPENKDLAPPKEGKIEEKPKVRELDIEIPPEPQSQARSRIEWLRRVRLTRRP